MASFESFEGREVVGSGVELPGASGGLNKALAVNAIEWHHGHKGTLVIEYEVAKVRFEPVGDTQALQRVHVCKVLGAAEVDSDLVGEVLEQQKVRIEEADGVHRLKYVDPDAPDADGPDPDEV